MTAARQTLVRLKKLLLACDVGLIVQGVELVATLDDPKIWGALLDGVDWVPPDGSALGSLAPNATFRIPKRGPTRPYRELALALLVANAPLPLRERVTSLAIQAWPETAPAILSSLREYPNLRVLELRLADAADLSPLASVPALEELRLSGNRLSLEGLGRAPKLRRLEAGGLFRTTAGIEGAPLESAILRSSALQDLRGLERTPVREVEVHGPAGIDLSSLARAPGLETLRITAHEVDLSGLAGSPLRVLHLQTRSPVALPALPKLEALGASALHFRESLPIARAIPRIATALPSLRRLALERSGGLDLEVLRGAALERLELRDCRIGDTSVLGSLDRLQELGLASLVANHLDDLPAATLLGRDGRPANQLDLSNTGIRSIRGVGRLKGLRILILRGCRELESLEGIEDSGIAVVDVSGCRHLDPAPLARLPELRLFLAHDHGLNAARIDPAIAAARTLDLSPDLQAALDLPPVRG